MEIPLIGFGSWLLKGKECREAVVRALDVGYRHIDTAFAYENHEDIARAIEGFPREDLFLTTKLAIDLSQIDDQNISSSVAEAVDDALRQLKTDYIDLLLIHWPNRSRPLEDILAAMHKVVETGKLRNPGVSNYTEHHLQDAYDRGLSVPFNQVEFHPHLHQKKLLDFCQSHGTRLIAYRPFGKGELLPNEPVLHEIARDHEKTAGQITLRWIVQKNIPVIPKAASEKHIQENFHIFDFQLSKEEMERIDGLNKNFRYCAAEWNEFDY